MKELAGKRLLVLGGTIATYDVVKTAQKMGAYVIVADYFENGITKDIADETALVSTNDISGLAKLIKTKNVDGVFTGASEFNIQNMINLCTYINLPVYATLEQWNICSDKSRFKEMCRANGVPVVPEYRVPEGEVTWRDIEYPLIVKPVDSFSGHGISICNDKRELTIGIEKAKYWSKSGKVILEKFMQGSNVEVYYLVQNGNPMLIAAADRYTNKEQNGSPVPVAFYHPSKWINIYLEKVDPAVRRMFENLQIKNGVFFMESFVENGKFMFYEMGLRLNATMEYHFVDYFNHFNPLKMMISYALTGSMGKEVQSQNKPVFSGRGCEVALLLKPGRIEKIIGVDEVRSWTETIHMIQFYYEGNVIEETGSLDQNFARIKLVAENESILKQLIQKLYNTISVLDNNRREMLIKEGNN